MKTVFRVGLLLPWSAWLLLAACSMPPQMRIENVNHPSYVDQDVRFRATYYFRVFGHCASSAEGKPPMTDTLYRFRMTGKANSLTTQVHFESGTLTASQIDPLGASVAYDEHNRQFYFKSQAESQAEGQRERKFDDLNRLMLQYRALPEAPASSSADAMLKQALQQVIAQRVESLKEGAVPIGAASASQSAGECQEKSRGFQILGPEGWRTFNQDERLLLAMSSSGKPLISTMQEISGRILNNQPIEAEMLLPLVREDLRISRTERELDRFSPTRPEEGQALLKTAIDQLSLKGPAK